MSGLILTRQTPEDVDIIACTEEQVVPLRKLCKKSPQRVVQIIDKSEQPNKVAKGQTPHGHNIAAALVAVGELVKGDNFTADRATTWNKLIDAGVVDALIFHVLNSATIFSTSPGLSQDLREKGLNQMQAPYYPTLEILSNASRWINRTAPTARDRTFLSALKANWSAMVERVWEEPLNSLRSEESHVFERVVVAALFYRILVADASFLDIAYKDRTIPVITRHWAYSGSCAANQMDAFMTSTVLCALARPNFPSLAQYMQEHKEFTKAQLLTQMCVGAGRTPYASKSDQTKTLVDVFGIRLGLLNGRDVEPVLEMFLEFLASDDLANMESFRRALAANDVFWRGLFSLLRRIHKGQGRDSGGQPTGKNLLVLPMIIVSGAFDVMTPTMRGELLCTCARAGFFDALDDVVEELLTVRGPNVCELLVQLFLAMRQGVIQCSTEDREVVGKQFPRWRTLAALFLHDVKTQRGSVPPVGIMPAQMSWQLFATIQVSCKPKKKCTHRGCDKDGSARCGTCKIVVYCGPECQKADWKGHKLLCARGWMAIVDNATKDSQMMDAVISDKPIPRVFKH